jgi:serine/arginine repetitive matrix protein 1
MKGLSADQDVRYSDKIVKELKTTNFPSILSHKPNFKKINFDVLRPWVTDQITKILGFEDDICIEFIFTLLEQNEEPKQIFIKIQGFLEEGTFKFMKSLWELMISAEESIHGIPKEFVDELTKAITQSRQRDNMISNTLKNMDNNSGAGHDHIHPSRMAQVDRGDSNILPSRMGQVDRDDRIKQERFRREFQGERRMSRSRSRDRYKRNSSKDRSVRRRDVYDRGGSNHGKNSSRDRDYDRYSANRSPDRRRRDSKSPSSRYKWEERHGRGSERRISREYEGSSKKNDQRGQSPLEDQYGRRSIRSQERTRSNSPDRRNSAKVDRYGRDSGRRSIRDQESPKKTSIIVEKQRGNDSPVLNMRDRDIERRSSIDQGNIRNEEIERRHSTDYPISPPRGSRRDQRRYESISPTVDEGRRAELDLKEKILLKKLKGSEKRLEDSPKRKDQDKDREISG